MQITEVSFSRTVQLKQYEPIKAIVRGTIAEDECPEEAFRIAKEFVDDQLLKALDAYNGTTAAGKVAKKTTKKKVAKKTTKKKVAKKNEGTSEPEDSGVRRTVSHGEVKEALKALWKKEGKDAAIAVLQEYSVKTSAELPEDKLLEVITKVEGRLK